MTIRKRILLSNTIMVFLALIFLLGVGGVLISIFKDEFLNDYSAGSEISENVGEAEEILKRSDSFGTEWDDMDKALSALDFRLCVTSENDRKIYDSLKNSEHETKEGIDDDDIDPGKVRMYLIEGTTILKSAVTQNGSKYILYAASSPDDKISRKIDRGVFEMFLMVFLCTGLIVICVLLVCSQLFTRSLVKQIMKPVQYLTEATVRMSKGNLSQPIAYGCNDEFRAVCDSFDEMQKKLRQSIEQKEAYEKARTEMISDISHDLRTPLTSIKGYIKGLMDGVADTEEKRQRYLGIAYRRSCDMDGLLTRLFYFSRLETGNMPFYKKDQNMKQFIETYVIQKQQEYESKMDIELSFGPGCEDCCCSIDADQFSRVFDNLVENSLKYAGSDALRIDFHVDVENGSGGEMLRIRVSDNGSGVEPEKISHVFERFFRGDEVRNSKCEGSGLGLYVCRYIVEAHGGSIGAENNGGFCVTVRIPVTEKEQVKCTRF
jgi:signal transduction histidine kinase